MATIQDKYRITDVIHTDLYGNDTYQFFRNFLASIRRNCWFGRNRLISHHIRVNVTETGEIVFELYTENGYRSARFDYTFLNNSKYRTRVEFLNKIAFMLKDMITQHLIWCEEYRHRTERFELDHTSDVAVPFLSGVQFKFKTEADFEDVRSEAVENRFVNNAIINKTAKINESFNVTIADVTYIYTALRTFSKNRMRKFSSALAERWTGTRRDPMQIEMEKLRREQREEIISKYTSMIDDCTPEHRWSSATQSAAYLELQQMIKDFKLKKMEEIAALKDERDMKLAELDNTLSCVLLNM